MVEIRVWFDDSTGRIHTIAGPPDSGFVTDERQDAIDDALETVWSALSNAGIAPAMSDKDNKEESMYVPKHRKVSVTNGSSAA